ncbi:serine hydrolase domain-containing protein [Symbioplanes lichenis]|uniref:serine hydrolase domain-containing protein n=1 Tax=Symbioplanes lichenis TaxID=1629072 RepID=UPI0027381EB0|nr:serine hydrolase domain-containing protein [Actinoplanes lichenis]
MSDDQLDQFPSLRPLLDAEVAGDERAGVQISLSLRGEQYDIAVGGNGMGAPMTAGSRVPWTCSSKPLGALSFAIAWEAGRIGLDDRVADHLPEYGEYGKDTIRMRDLLTHTTGIPDPMLSLDTQGSEVPQWAELEPLIWYLICNVEPQQKRGTLMSYNPITNWFVLDRVLTTVEGSAPGDSYRALFKRLGIAATLGLDPDADPELGVMPVAPPEEADGLRNMIMASGLPLPGTGVWGTMADLRVAGEALLTGHARDGEQLVRAATLEAITATHWPGTPRNMFSDTNFPYGLGFMTLPHLLGKACSYRVYGHAGGNTSTLLIDPAAELVLAVYWNGRLPDVPTVTRRHALVQAIYTDLGIEPAAQFEIVTA